MLVRFSTHICITRHQWIKWFVSIFIQHHPFNVVCDVIGGIEKAYVCIWCYLYCFSSTNWVELVRSSRLRITRACHSRHLFVSLPADFVIVYFLPNCSIVIVTEDCVVNHWIKPSLPLTTGFLFTKREDASPPQDDIVKCKYFPRYWSFVRGIQRSPVNSPHKGQWREASMFSLIYSRIKGWVNNREADDYLRRHRADYDVTVMSSHKTQTPTKLI